MLSEQLQGLDQTLKKGINASYRPSMFDMEGRSCSHHSSRVGKVLIPPHPNLLFSKPRKIQISEFAYEEPNISQFKCLH